jgi:hypothetical protein
MKAPAGHVREGTSCWAVRLPKRAVGCTLLLKGLEAEDSSSSAEWAALATALMPPSWLEPAIIECAKSHSFELKALAS